MKRLITAIAIAAAAAAPIYAQTTQKLTASKLNEYGLIYTLPTTTLDVTVEAEKTVRQPGEYYLYAKKYLGLDPISEPSVSYRILSITVTPRGIADENERYLVQFKSGSTPFMMVSNENFPLAVNTESAPSFPTADIPVARPAEPTILEKPVASQAVTAEMLQSTSSAKRAELAAARIFELRQNRNEIIAGNADNMPSDGQAMQLALDNLAAQEAALTAMFTGTEQTSTQVATFSFTPSADGGDRTETTIARLSALDGIVDANNLSGDPIKLRLTVTERGTLPKNEKGEEKRFPKGGLAYRIPGTANVVTTFNGRTLSNNNVEVAQFGIVFGLEPALFTNKKTPAYAIFNPTTGSVTEVGTAQ